MIFQITDKSKKAVFDLLCDVKYSRATDFFKNIPKGMNQSDYENACEYIVKSELIKGLSFKRNVEGKVLIDGIIGNLELTEKGKNEIDYLSQS